MSRRMRLLLCLGLVVLAGVSLMLGPAKLSASEVFSGLIASDDNPISVVIQQIRLPRTLLAMMVGASLGAAGAVMQGLLRNPLAEPGVLGISSASALGAVLTIQTGLSAVFSYALPVGALCGAASAVLLIFALCGSRGGTLSMILAGIAVSALSGALTALVLNLSPNPFAASEIMFWLMGSLANSAFSHVALAAPFIVCGFVLLSRTGIGLDSLSLGEEVSATMGIDMTRLQRQVLIGTALLVGASTAVAGAIGFVGLVVPHLLRRSVKFRPSALLWASALGGALLVLAADIAVRVLLPSKDLKLGVVMAMIGAPLFLHLILKIRKEQE